MRENSGQGKGKNNDLDPTLDEHRGERDIARGSRRPDQAFDIGGDAAVRGEKPGPGKRAGGESGPDTRTPATDLPTDR